MKIATECSIGRWTECSTERLPESLVEWRAVLLFSLYVVKHVQLLTGGLEAPEQYADTKFSEGPQDRFVF